jgi:hypothetical protein
MQLEELMGAVPWKWGEQRLKEEADAARLQEKAELLAPDIQEAILEGRQAKGMQLEDLTRTMPGAWGRSGCTPPDTERKQDENH